MYVIFGDKHHVIKGRMDNVALCGQRTRGELLFADKPVSCFAVCGSCTGQGEVAPSTVIKERVLTPTVETPKVQFVDKASLDLSDAPRKRGRQPGSKRCPLCNRVRVLNARGTCGC